MDGALLTGRWAAGAILEFGLPCSDIRDGVAFQVLVHQTRDGATVEIDRVPRLAPIRIPASLLDPTHTHWSA